MVGEGLAQVELQRDTVGFTRQFAKGAQDALA
jgi:hypothetical protein